LSEIKIHILIWFAIRIIKSNFIESHRGFVVTISVFFCK